MPRQSLPSPLSNGSSPPAGTTSTTSRSTSTTKIADSVAPLEFTVMTIIDQITDHVHARKRLPNRRAATTFDFEHNGKRFVATYLSFPNGRGGEIFISNHKVGSHLDVCVRDLGFAASLALQFGCSLDKLRRSLLRNDDDSPATALGAALDVVAGGRDEDHRC